MRNTEDKQMNRTDRFSSRKALRNNGTPAEAALWTLLKNRQIEGLKFRRQHSIENYIVDFYCPEIGLIIELDGQIHVDNEAYDEQRTSKIESLRGLYVMRFENKFVFEHPDVILDEISAYKKEWEQARRK